MINGLNNWYSGKRVFVTGHTGFKGSWLTGWLTAAGARVTGLALRPEPGRPSLYDLAALDSRIQSVIADICDRSELDRALADSEPDIVFHLAAQSLVRQSYADPVETFRTNVLGTCQILDAIRSVKSVSSVVIVTSDKCYENQGTGQLYTETDPMGGWDPYSASKGSAELATAAFRRSFFGSGGPAVATARAGNVIGPGDWGADRIVPDMMTAAANGSVAIIRNPSAVRPWQFVLEPLRGYLMLGRALATRGQEFAGAWNFGPRPEDGVSVGELSIRVQKAWGDVIVKNEPQPGAPHEASILRLDSSKAADKLEWKPALSLSRAVELTVQGYRQLLGNEVLSSLDTTMQAYWNEVDAARTVT